MFAFLKNHPFAVEAIFDRSLVFTFAINKSQIENLIPPCLELDTFSDEWAFIAVAMVQTKNLKPKGFPDIFGNDFFLIGYRVFVRYINESGKRLRGLYILKSETDSSRMQLFGNIFTHYEYSTTDIHQASFDGRLEITSFKSDFQVVVDMRESENVGLPSGSPFEAWKDARKFAGPLPFTFSYLPKLEKVLIIEGVRENWTPKPVGVLKYHFSFLNKMNLHDVRLANTFVIENIPYRWKKGKLDQWKRP